MLQSFRKLRIPSWTHRPVASLRWFSDDEKFEKKKKPTEVKEEKSKENENKKKEASDRLSSLLESMSKTPRTEIKIQTAPKKKPPKVEVTEEEKAESKVKKITETIAKKIGGDVQKTESELLSKLLGTKDLKSSGSLSELISGMKIDDENKPKQFKKDTEHRRDDRENRRDDRESYSRADNVRRALGPSRDRNFQDRNFQSRSEPAPSSGVVNLFGADPLGIFTKASTTKDPLETWSKLAQRDFKLAVTHPPSNYFEKMIMWTEQGKLWKFPIDNEQGMDEEKQVDFSEHVLLEMYLDDWCPSSGPVRHFMELVCVGLSKNNFLTAKEKKDHIAWYRDYFEEKKDLLGDLMTMQKATQQPKLEA